jgi:hypothetical protein
MKADKKIRDELLYCSLFMLQTLYHIGSKRFVVAVLSCNRFPFYLLKMDSKIIITNDKKKSFISDDSGVRYFY